MATFKFKINPRGTISKKKWCVLEYLIIILKL